MVTKMDHITEWLLRGTCKKIVTIKPLSKGITEIRKGIKVMVTGSERLDSIHNIKETRGFVPFKKKDFKGPVYINHFYLYSQDVCKLWHGSKLKLDVIKCFESSHSPVKNGIDVPICFASTDRHISGSFISGFRNKDITAGTFNGQRMMVEMYEDAFKILDVGGYLHRVSNDGFYRTLTLGIPEEFICEQEKKVLEVIEVPNVREYIKDFIIFKPWKLVWKGEVKYREYDGEGEWNSNIYVAELDPVVIENGKITKNEHLAKLAKFLGQPYAYVEM